MLGQRCPGKMLNYALTEERILIQTHSRFDCGGGMADKRKKRWVASVKTDSTHPPAGLFTKSATIIARTLASKEVSPKGPSSGMRMLTFFINRAGRGLNPKRRAELEKAKFLLSKRVAQDREKPERKTAA